MAKRRQRITNRRIEEILLHWTDKHTNVRGLNGDATVGHRCVKNYVKCLRFNPKDHFASSEEEVSSQYVTYLFSNLQLIIEDR
jgi:hypothetical protein